MLASAPAFAQPRQEALVIDRPVEHQRRIDAVMAQGREEGRRLPVAVRDFREQLLASGRPAAQACHVGLRPGFIDKHQPRGIDVAWCAAFQRRRLRATSGRSCSVANSVFFEAEPGISNRAPHRTVARHHAAFAQLRLQSTQR